MHLKIYTVLKVFLCVKTKTCILYIIGKLSKYITNEDDNVIQVGSMSIILLFFMSDIVLLYMSNEGCSTFIIHHFP